MRWTTSMSQLAQGLLLIDSQLREQRWHPTLQMWLNGISESRSLSSRVVGQGCKDNVSVGPRASTDAITWHLNISTWLLREPNRCDIWCSVQIEGANSQRMLCHMHKMKLQMNFPKSWMSCTQCKEIPLLSVIFVAVSVVGILNSQWTSFNVFLALWFRTHSPLPNASMMGPQHYAAVPQGPHVDPRAAGEA